MNVKTIAIFSLLVAVATLAIAYLDYSRKTGMEMFSPLRK